MSINLPKYVKTSRPTGQIISQFLKDETKDFSVTNAIQIIDSVHGDGSLPNLLIRKKHLSDKIVGGYISQSEKSVQIVLSEKSEEFEEIAIHEIGHFLDHQAFGNGIYRGSEKGRAFSDWRKSVESSKAVKNIIDWKVGEIVEIKLRFGTIIRFVTQERKDYLLSRRELFARTYTQFIALQSKNELLLEQIESFRKSENFLIKDEFWQDDDFQPIYEFFLQHFKKIGWIEL